MAKKTARINVALVCKETGATNYVTTVNKDNKPQTVRKYCPSLKRHTEHKLKEKLK
jgi:ribosomal protein L33